MAIFDFQDYRDFLEQRLEELKSGPRPVSERQLAKRCGFGSPSYFKSILSGKRNLTEKSADQVATGLKLTKSEAEYFFALVKMNQAKTEAQKEQYLKELESLRQFTSYHHLESKQDDYLSDWRYLVIRELLSLQGASGDPAWIAKQFDPPISKEWVIQALRRLQGLDLVEVDEGEWKLKHTTVTTGQAAGSINANFLHEQALENARKALVHLDELERDFSLIYLSLSENDFEEIREKVFNFRKKLLEEYGETKLSDRFVAQFNLSVFRITKAIDEQ